jgi:hypothetical protein
MAVSNLVKEMLDKFAKELQKSIDDDIMRTLFGETYELNISTSTVSGTQYQTAMPSWNPSRHGWHNPEWNEMIEWCVQMFGPTAKDGVWTPGERWYANNAKFWFRDEADLLMFILRWS